MWSRTCTHPSISLVATRWLWSKSCGARTNWSRRILRAKCFYPRTGAHILGRRMLLLCGTTSSNGALFSLCQTLKLLLICHSTSPFRLVSILRNQFHLTKISLINGCYHWNTNEMQFYVTLWELKCKRAIFAMAFSVLIVKLVKDKLLLESLLFVLIYWHFLLANNKCLNFGLYSY